ncbi:hypothetical protein JW921_02200 [Candidatus Fermentibacterales bacterium]|nr:hypothetical protein [Candidatus Fermentibacterales bacterium]
MGPVLAVLVALSAVGSTQLPLERRVFCDGSDYLLQYDDGEGWWLTWGGAYRGVWFRVEDFTTAPVDIIGLELWFYHHPGYPWDTPFFFAEIWTGDDQSGPVTQLYSETAPATHDSAVRLEVDPPIGSGPDFWVLVNTEMSSGGWPSSLGDNGPNFTGHCHSFVAGNPWSQGDLMIRADVDPLGLAETTWGRIKSLLL